MKLKVVAPSVTDQGVKVYLDDKEIRGLTALDVSIALGELNEAVLRFHPSAIEIEGEFEAKVNIDGRKFLLTLL